MYAPRLGTPPTAVRKRVYKVPSLSKRARSAIVEEVHAVSQLISALFAYKRVLLKLREVRQLREV